MAENQKKNRFSKTKLLVHYLHRFLETIADNYTAVFAAQSAFFLLLSIVPLTSLILAVTTYLPFTQEDVLNLVMRIISDDLQSYVSTIINDLYSRAGSTVISLSVITLLWSASKGIAALMDGFNTMYQLRKDYSILKLRLVAIVYTILLIVVFALVMSGYMIVGHYYQIYIHDIFAVESKAKTLFLLIRYVWGWLLFYTFILMLYVLLPGGFGIPKDDEEKLNLGKRTKSQMPGAAFASIAWLVISRLAVLYIQHFPNFSLMYGSLAGIVLAMLWLYFCMYSLFIGAVINHLLSKGYLTQVKKMLK